MNERHGDIWKSGAQAIVIPTNRITTPRGRAVMGAGLAKQCKDLYPDVDVTLAQRMRNYGSEWLHIIEVHDRVLLMFPTKGNWRHPAKMENIRRNVPRLLDLTTMNGWQTVALPRLGCGLGQLSWDKEVGPYLHQHLDFRFTVWTF